MAQQNYQRIAYTYQVRPQIAPINLERVIFNLDYEHYTIEVANTYAQGHNYFQCYVTYAGHDHVHDRFNRVLEFNVIASEMTNDNHIRDEILEGARMYIDVAYDIESELRG
jgi:hypothetical protein